MILGDSLQVMASLAEREGLRGKVQCIYLDPPYGIKFNSNFQWSTTSRDVKDGKADHITSRSRSSRDLARDPQLPDLPAGSAASPAICDRVGVDLRADRAPSSGR
jgi:DNA modification methylase